MATEKTVPKQLTPWKPGQSGNPAGRPKGARHKLGKAFIEAMYADFLQHGNVTIERVCAEKPDQYLKVIASILPKELQITDATLADLSDNEIVEYYAAVRAIATAVNGAAAGRRDKAARRNQDAGIKLN